MASKRPTIDAEWAELIVGLRLRVPDCWWVGYNSQEANDGKLKSFDVSSQKWMLELDSDKGTEYPIAYTAIYQYADSNASSFEDYNVPPEPVFEGVEEDVGVNNKIYTITKSADWKKIDKNNLEDNNNTARAIEPIPWTGDNEEFEVKATPEEIEFFKDQRGEISFENILWWSLPKFGNENLFQWQAGRMRNYMTKLMNDPHKPYTPRHFKPDEGKVITADNTARFYGCLLGRMFDGNPSMNQMFSTRDMFDACEPIKQSMTLDCFKDMVRCLHFSDDWDEDDEEWDRIYTDAKQEPTEETSPHRRKFSMLEDAYNRRWQDMVNFGKWITADESRVAGWYKSCMTQGPEPKPIQTGATLHSLCVTEGRLATYKLFVRVYGGKQDTDLNRRHPNTASVLKFVTLYSIMLESFVNKGHCLVMDSAYMGDVMALIGRHEWGINMVGTCQSNRTGAGKMSKYDLNCGAIDKGTYESLLYQHKDEALTFAVWGDNNFVKTLSNFHTPIIINRGLKRKRRDPITKRRALHQTPVPCPAQIKSYCETFHLIDKGNCAEAKYDLAGESHNHGWTPKLASRLFNIHLNNVYKLYCCFVEDHSQTIRLRYKPKPIRECLKKLAYSLLSQGEAIRKRKAVAPVQVDVGTSPLGRKIRSDAKGQFRTPSPAGRNHSQTPRTFAEPWHKSTAYKQKKNMTKQIGLQDWRKHQSVATVCKNDGQYCQYQFCPGKD